MATIYKCDKCGKIIKYSRFKVEIIDYDRKLLEEEYNFNSFIFCEKCIKPFIKHFKGLLKKDKK